MNRNYQKSAVQMYNNNATAIDPTTPYTVSFGNTCTDTGCSIKEQTNGARIVNSGLYTFHFDASYLNGATAGAITAQLYRDGVPMPCAFATDAIGATEDGSLSFQTTLAVNTCCNIQPVFSVVITSDTVTALTLNHVAFGIVKQA